MVALKRAVDCTRSLVTGNQLSCVYSNLIETTFEMNIVASSIMMKIDPRQFSVVAVVVVVAAVVFVVNSFDCSNRQGACHLC